MSNSVIPIVDGLDFQAKYFWIKACHLLRHTSDIIKVSYETNVTGFDDVAIEYLPARRVIDQEIHREFFQCKFHVDLSKEITCEALINPEFICATSESLLQKLYKNYKKDPDVYKTSIYNLVNIWQVNDVLRKLLNNEGGLILDKLFDNTTDKSQHGKIRKLWREHLGVDNIELGVVLKQLRINYNFKSGSHLDDELNNLFSSVNLQQMDRSLRTNPYVGLIQRLHKEKKNQLTKVDLNLIITQEKLWAKTTTEDVLAHKIGIRTFSSGSDAIAIETDEYLCLLRYFEGRFIIDSSLWNNSVLPELQKLASVALSTLKPIMLHLDTHLSVAFAFGYILHTKTGIEVSVVQKLRNGGRSIMKLWSVEIQSEQPCWEFSESIYDSHKSDLVIAISITRDVTTDVKEFVDQKIPKCSRILNSIILPSPSGSVIRDAEHIIQAAEQLVSHVRSIRTSEEKKGNIHIFLAAPNTFAFSLGRLAQSFGRTSLYEYDFENLRHGTYQLAISLP